MLEMLGDRDYLRHGCRSPFRNGFCLLGKANLHPLLFTQSKLRHPVSRQLSVEMRPGSPYGTDNCPAGMAEPVSLGPAGLSPLVPVAAGRLPGTCCCFAPAHRAMGRQLESRSLHN